MMEELPAMEETDMLSVVDVYEDIKPADSAIVEDAQLDASASKPPEGKAYVPDFSTDFIFHEPESSGRKVCQRHPGSCHKEPIFFTKSKIARRHRASRLLKIDMDKFFKRFYELRHQDAVNGKKNSLTTMLESTHIMDS